VSAVGESAPMCDCACRTETSKSEIARVKAAGGWIGDGRVCDVLAVSRAFGDWEFKGDGTATLLKEGIKYEWWDADFAAKVKFTADTVLPTPAVKIQPVSEKTQDEFVVVATDGLWCVLLWHL
jgi:protein phosphatase 1A